jgi:hypothetical protein
MAFAQNFFKYMAFEPPAGPSFNATGYDFDRDPPRLAYTASIVNAATFNPITGEIEFGHLNAFREAGARVHGRTLVRLASLFRYSARARINYDLRGLGAWDGLGSPACKPVDLGSRYRRSHPKSHRRSRRR